MNASRPNAISRRSFVWGAAAAAVLANATMARASDPGRSRRFAYLGTYTAGIGNGQGIYLYEASALSGELRLVKLAASIPHPSFLIAAPSGKLLYSTNEVSKFQGNS